MPARIVVLAVLVCCTAALRADDNPYEQVSVAQRMDAIRRAQVWSPLDVSSRNLESGPFMRGAFSAGETVTCEYVKKRSDGATPKFWCAMSRSGQVKVKYGEDNGEVYAEVAATRLLWALGFGADGMFPVKVICHGCSADPSKDAVVPSVAVHTFDPAVVERPAAGDTIESRKDSGWEWIELNSVDESRGGAPLAHRDALKLLAVLIQHTDSKPAQQRLLCLDRVKGIAARVDGSCKHPFMMVGDLGKTFGKANIFNRDNPGAVSLKAWADAAIWRGDKGCVGALDQSFTGSLDRPVISEDGRRFLAGLLSQLSDRQIRDLFEVAGFARRDKASMVDDWVRVFKQKRDEIAERRCENPAL